MKSRSRALGLKQIFIIFLSLVIPSLTFATGMVSIVSVGVQEGEEAQSCEPDLLVTAPAIPMVYSRGGNIVYIYDQVTNSGGSTAAASTMRYYISNKQPVEYTSANLLGERRIKSLAPSEASTSNKLTFTLPQGLPQDTYYIASCVDADNEVEESNEENNCVNSSLDRVIRITQPPESCFQKSVQSSLLVPFAFDGFDPGIQRSISTGDAKERLLERFGPALRINEKIIPGVQPELNEKIETWYYDGLEVDITSLVDSDYHSIKRILLTKGEFKLKGGISIGSTRNEVISLLGNPDRKISYTLMDPLHYNIDYHNIERNSSEQKASVYSHIQINVELDADSRVEKILWSYSQEYSKLQ